MAEIASSVIRRPVTVLAVGALALAGRASGQTSLSIYSDGRVVVRRTLSQALEKGRTALTLKIDGLDPATLFSPDTSVALVSAVARPATDRGAALPAAGGETLAVVHGKGGTVRAPVLRVAPPPDRGADGRRLLAAPRGPRPEFEFAGFVRQRAPEAPAPAAGEEAVGETHVYLLPARVALEPGTPVTTALFPRSSVGYSQELIVPGVLPWRGFLGSSPAEPNRVPVEVWYTLKRARGTLFGDRPLPAGTVQLYQADSAGRVQLVGEARSDHTAPGRDLRVQSGNAFDVTAERVQTDYGQEQIPPPKRGMPARQRVTASFKVTIANAKAEAVTVDVREARFGVWRVVESSVPAEKLSATEVRFRVSIPASGDATLTYTVQAES